MLKKYVVIGSSAASISVLTKLRELDRKSQILCISADQDLPYNRCLLADLLCDTYTQEQIYLKNNSFFQDNNIELMLNTRVTQIIPESRELIVTDSNNIICTVSYDTLFLGTGKSAYIPDIAGVHINGVMPFFDLRDVRDIKNYMQQNLVSNITIIGAGLTGLECADALLGFTPNSSININIIEKAAHVLPSILDAQAAQYLNNKSVTLLLNTCVTEILECNNKVSGVKLYSGQELATDLVIFATGGRTNIELARSAGLEISDNELCVNEYMQTSSKNIYAAGDICRIKNLATGEYIQSFLWSDAIIQGTIAALNMVGTAQKYPGAFIINMSTIFDIPVVSCGYVTQYSDISSGVSSITKKWPDYYHRYFIKDNALIGFIMVGKITNLSGLKNAILFKTLPKFKLTWD
ncbi:MAG: FAD-dependent oxidoreductase [bacterium]